MGSLKIFLKCLQGSFIWILGTNIHLQRRDPWGVVRKGFVRWFGKQREWLSPISCLNYEQGLLGSLKETLGGFTSLFPSGEKIPIQGDGGLYTNYHKHWSRSNWRLISTHSYDGDVRRKRKICLEPLYILSWRVIRWPIVTATNLAATTSLPSCGWAPAAYWRIIPDSPMLSRNSMATSLTGCTLNSFGPIDVVCLALLEMIIQ